MIGGSLRLLYLICTVAADRHQPAPVPAQEGPPFVAAEAAFGDRAGVAVRPPGRPPIAQPVRALENEINRTSTRGDLRALLRSRDS